MTKVYNNMMNHQVEQLNCPICMMVYRRPITIACGHTFCSSCLTNSLRQHRNCPICRQHVSSIPSKIRVDEQLQLIIDHYRRAIHKIQGKARIENIYTEFKAERLLLIDINTADLLLPYNKITATFELQSGALIDRMERFVARQQLPFNQYSVVCKLLHIEEIRKNLYKGVLQGCAFCSIESQEVESQLSLEMDDQEYFYRTCKSKEISETSDIDPAEFQPFFEHFDRIEEEFLKKLIFARIDLNVFNQKNDPIALFYCILGVINLNKDSKYKIAITFDDEKRLAFLKEYLEQNQQKIRSKPSTLVHISSQSANEKRFVLLILLLVLMYLFAQSQDL